MQNLWVLKRWLREAITLAELAASSVNYILGTFWEKKSRHSPVRSRLKIVFRGWENLKVLQANHKHRGKSLISSPSQGNYVTAVCGSPRSCWDFAHELSIFLAVSRFRESFRQLRRLGMSVYRQEPMGPWAPDIGYKLVFNKKYIYRLFSIVFPHNLS